MPEEKKLLAVLEEFKLLSARLLCAGRWMKVDFKAFWSLHLLLAGLRLLSSAYTLAKLNNTNSLDFPLSPQKKILLLQSPTDPSPPHFLLLKFSCPLLSAEGSPLDFCWMLGRNPAHLNLGRTIAYTSGEQKTLGWALLLASPIAPSQVWCGYIKENIIQTSYNCGYN